MKFNSYNVNHVINVAGSCVEIKQLEPILDWMKKVLKSQEEIEFAMFFIDKKFNELKRREYYENESDFSENYWMQ